MNIQKRWSKYRKEFYIGNTGFAIFGVTHKRKGWILALMLFGHSLWIELSYKNYNKSEFKE